METMLFRLGYVFVMFFAQHTAQKVTTRCNNVRFRTLMCLDATIVQINEISVNISSDSGPKKCRGNKTCSFKLPKDHSYYESIRKACDGHISCDGIRAEPINFTCEGAVVTSHYTFIRFSCVESKETKMAVTCHWGTGLPDALLCQPGYGIELKNVYTGVATSNSCQPIRGDCVERENELILQNYREQCNGRLACEGYSEREHETSTSCNVENGQTLQIMEYSCVQYPTLSSLKCFGSNFEDVRCNQQQFLEIVNIFIGVTAEDTCLNDDLNQASGCLKTLISVSPTRHNYISETCFTVGCRNVTVRNHTQVPCNGRYRVSSYTLMFYRCHKETHRIITCSGEIFGSSKCSPGSTMNVYGAFYIYLPENTGRQCSPITIAEDTMRLCPVHISTSDPDYYQDILNKCNGQQSCHNLKAKEAGHRDCHGTMSDSHSVEILYTCTAATALWEDITHDPTAATINHDPGMVSLSSVTSTDDTNFGHNASFVDEQGHPLSIMYIAVSVPVAVFVAVFVVVLVVCLVKRRNQKKNTDANGEHTRYPDQSGEHHNGDINVYSLTPEIPHKHNGGFQDGHTGNGVNKPDVNSDEPYSIVRKGVNTSPKTDIYAPLQKANTDLVLENNLKHRDNIEPYIGAASPGGDLLSSHTQYTSDQDPSEVRDGHLHNLSDPERSIAQLNDQNVDFDIDCDTILFDNKMYGSLN